MKELALCISVFLNLLFIYKLKGFYDEKVFYHSKWAEWESEYWYLRSFEQNRYVSIRKTPKGEITQEEYDKLQAQNHSEYKHD